MGDDLSIRRPKGPALRSMSARTCSSLSKRHARSGQAAVALCTRFIRSVDHDLSHRRRQSDPPAAWSLNTVLIEPSASRGTPRAQAPSTDSRVESLRQAARSRCARSGLSTAMSATLSRGTSSPTAIRKDSSPLPRAHRLADRGVFRHANPFQKRHFLTSYDAPLAKAACDGSRDHAFALFAPQPASALGAKPMRARGACTTALAGREAKGSSSRREHPRCLCTKGLGLYQALRHARADSSSSRPPSASSATWPHPTHWTRRWT